MAERLDYHAVAPEATHGLVEIARWVRQGSLAPALIELARLRASQINGCAYCLEEHAQRSRRLGVPESQLNTLAAWQESTAFSERERAALAWTDALTLVAGEHVPDAVWAAVRPHFTEREILELSMAIVEINAWNRLAVAFRIPPEFPAPPSPATPPSTP